MTISSLFGRTSRTLAMSAAVVGTLGLAAAPPAHALGTGAAVGIGLGAFALGSALAAPYYYGYPGYYGYPAYYYAPPAAYYPPAPAYRTCWSPYYRTYVAC